MASKAIPTKRSTDQINILNIGLMIISAALAFVWPFYLFLVAYAVLGPLHYLTEISWLHDRNYYTSRKGDSLFLIVIGIVYGVALLGLALQSILPNSIVVAFVASIVLAHSKSRRSRILLI